MVIEAPETLPELLSLLIQIGLVLLILVFIFIGLRILKILGAVQQITDTVTEILETVNLVLWQPVRFFSVVMDKLQRFMKPKRR